MRTVNPGPLRPKLLYANERTFIHWSLRGVPAPPFVGVQDVGKVVVLGVGRGESVGGGQWAYRKLKVGG